MKLAYLCDCCRLCCQQLIVEADAFDVLREPRIEAERPLGRHSASLSLLDACWIVAAPGMPCPFLNSDGRCRIYPSRPQVCVAFAAGSSKCQQLRQAHGLAALAPRPVTDEMLGEIQAELLDEQKSGTEPIESAGVTCSLL